MLFDYLVAKFSKNNWPTLECLIIGGGIIVGGVNMKKILALGRGVKYG